MQKPNVADIGLIFMDIGKGMPKELELKMQTFRSRELWTEKTSYDNKELEKCDNFQDK